MTDKASLDKWHQEKRLIGWKAYYAFVPAELAKVLRETQRKWKYENPKHYQYK